MNTRSLRFFIFATALCCSTAAQATNRITNTTQLDPAINLHRILKTLCKANNEVPLQQEVYNLQRGKEFTEEELLSICELSLKKVSHYDDLGASPAYTELQSFTKSLVTKLKDYKVSGVGFTSHISGAFFGNHETFDTTFVFKNADGTACNRTFTLDYGSLGLNIGLTYRFDLILAVGTDLSRYSARTPIKFNTGAVFAISTGIPQFGITILPIQDAPGSLVILHFGLGLSTPTISVVYGNNTMTPKKMES